MAIIKTLGVYVLLGPPIGWLVLAFGIMSASGGSGGSSDPIGAFLNMFPLIIVGVALSYIIGVLPALLVGLAVLPANDFSKATGLLYVMIVGLLAGVIFALNFDRTTSPLGTRFYFGLKVLTCLIPSLICWLIARRLRAVAETKNETV